MGIRLVTWDEKDKKRPPGRTTRKKEEKGPLWPLGLLISFFHPGAFSTLIFADSQVRLSDFNTKLSI